MATESPGPRLPASGAGRLFAFKEVTMSCFGWLRTSYRKVSAPRCNRDRKHRRATMHLIAQVDRMDERVLLSTLTVTNTNSSGPGSLPYEISKAGPGDTIDATGVRGTIRLNGELSISRSLTIDGP